MATSLGPEAPKPADRPRNHACKVCSRHFIRAEHLQRHLLTHENHKPNKCKGCNTRFSRPDVLLRHTRKCIPYSRMIEAADRENGHTNNDAGTTAEPQQAGYAQTSDLPRFRPLDTGQVQHEQRGVANPQQHADTNNLRSSANVASSQLDQMQFPSGMTRPLNDMYTRMNNLESSQFNVSMLDPDMLRLDASRNPTALALPNTNNLGPWAPAGSSTNLNHRPGANFNDTTRNGIVDPHLPAAPLTGSTRSFSEGSISMDTTDQSIAMTEHSQAIFNDDSMFLEDFLLPELVTNITEGTTPIHTDYGPTALQSPATRNETDISEARLFSPRPTDEARGPHLFDISPRDVDRFQKDILNTRLSNNFPFPRRSRILRCLSAYFDHVNPHVPIVQQATFSLCGTAPALVLAMLGMGALITSETQFAVAAYEAACTLLDHETKVNVRPSSQFEFGPIQALLLCVHFGAFSDNQTFVQRSQAQLNRVSRMLRFGLDELSAKRAESEQDWITWSFIETFSRLASWSCSMSAILFAYDDSFHINTQHFLQHVPLPLDEDLWKARSAQEWSSLGGPSRPHGDLDFLTIAEFLLQGKPIPEQLSCFGLFSIIGWFLLYICNHERMKLLVGSLNMFETEFNSKIGVGLGAWETLTRRHLRTDQVMFRQLNPLTSDSFPLLGSAYYHLYVGDELRTLKEIAGKQALANGMPSSETFPEFNPRPETYKAVRYAANSWLVRAKLGISHFQQSPDVYGPHGAMGAYESALILSWWLSVGQPAQTPDRLTNEENASVRALQALLTEVIAEVEDQDIYCNDETARALAPLVFCYRSMDRSVFTYTRTLRQALDAFQSQMRAKTVAR